ncbi:general stress protein CTC [bacterium BMS3Abin03]|nr:general stress protein CTC [bacterium BMS3Abin03]
MEIVVLEAKERKNSDKSSRKSLRNEGRVPGIFYSKHHKPISMDVSAQALHPLVFSAQTHLISLKINGHDEYECILKDVQFDPVTDKIIHFDLIGFKRGEKIQVDAPVQLLGLAAGVKEGGILQLALHKLDIECFPKYIPAHLDINIENLQIGDAVYVRDLEYENVTILNSEDAIVVSVTHPKVEKEVEVEELAEGEEAQEPEVIEKGKEVAEEKKEQES